MFLKFDLRAFACALGHYLHVGGYLSHFEIKTSQNALSCCKGMAMQIIERHKPRSHEN